MRTKIWTKEDLALYQLQQKFGDKYGKKLGDAATKTGIEAAKNYFKKSCAKKQLKRLMI